MAESVTVNGNTYHSGSTAPGNMGNGGFRSNLIAMLADAIADIGRNRVATSATPLAIGTGARVFTLSAPVPFTPGPFSFVMAVDGGDAGNAMFGRVTAQAGTSLTVEVLRTNGGGTVSDWVITTVGEAGAEGPVGGTARTLITVADSPYAAAHGDRLWIDTSGGPVTVALPAAPALNHRVEFYDRARTWATNNLTVARNGETIEAASEDLSCDVNGASVIVQYDDNTWRVSDA